MMMHEVLRVDDAKTSLWLLINLAIVEVTKSRYAVVFHGNRISRLHWARNSRVIVICGAIDPSEIREMDFRQVCVEEHSNYKWGKHSRTTGSTGH